MAEVKWIKLMTDMFDNSKIKYLRSLPQGNDIVLFWVMLLSKAGKCNSNGFIFLTENIPYTKEMLSAEFGFEINLVTLALESLIRLGMISISEENLIEISNWNEYQNIEGLDKIREQTRKRVAKFRQKQKENNQKELPSTTKVVDSNITCNVTVTQCNETEEDIEEDIYNISKDILVSKNLIPVQEAWNNLGLSRLVSIKGNRLKQLNARIKEYGIDTVIETINKIKESNFLMGDNNRNWIITFDWFIKPSNFIKVLEGNYKEVKKVRSTEYTKWD